LIDAVPVVTPVRKKGKPMVEAGTADYPLGAVPSTNIPAQLTLLVGREHEIAEACRLLLGDVRLLTLTGPPGIGKTRLASQVARSLLAHFPDGIYSVNMAPVSEPAAVLQAIAGTLGVGQFGQQSLIDVLEISLSEKRMLLLLDNFEQVLPAGADIARLLKAAPGLKALVTSRELLHLSGERAFVVPPLSLPPVLAAVSELRRLGPLSPEQLMPYESVQLFLQRAVALKSDFVLDASNASAVAEICRRLDGLPLAIELAAARIRHLPPEAILQRLQHSLQVLTGGAYDLPHRQQSLRATIEWSYDLLDDEEKKLFRCLAAFRGGRTLEALEAVCAPTAHSYDVLEGLGSLMDKSLVFQATGPQGEPRYMLLETIHEFAGDKLAEAGGGSEEQIVHRNHALYFTALAERTEPKLKGADQVDWLERLYAEQDNFRIALEWAHRHDIDLGLRLAAALGTFWNRRGYLQEGKAQATAMLARAREQGVTPTSSMARNLCTVGLIAFRQGDFVPARSVLRESLAIYEQLPPEADRSGLTESLNILGIVESRLDSIQARLKLHEEALAIAREMGDSWGVARSLFQLGHTARISGEYELARVRFEESLTIFREWGDQFNIGLALAGLALIAASQGENASARDLFELGLAIFRKLGDVWGVSSILYSLASVAQSTKDYAGARAIHEENLTYMRELGVRVDMAQTFEKLGRIAYAQGDYEEAFQLHKRSMGLFKDLQDKVGIAFSLMNAGGTVAAATAAGARRQRRSEAEDAERLAPVLQAAHLIGAAEALFAALGFQPDPESLQLFRAYTEAARTALGSRAYNRAHASGEEMSSEDALTLAFSLPSPERPEKQRQPAQGAGASRGPFGALSRREREVASLVAQGRSNREIADALAITERTVEGHISSMLAKLDFRSRAQISAWVVEQGLARATS
jgi:predicted ATPase/DNA-binding CsgD family transcriptional regulator